MPFLGQSPAAVITGNGILDGTVTAADLYTTLDLSSKTITYPSNSVTATVLHTTAITDKLGYTPLQSSDLTGYATETYVNTQVTNLVDSAPGALDTLNELAAALGDDANFATTVTNSLALKAPLASPSFTGNLSVDTNTLYVDSTNNRVGIGTSSPAQKLSVIGNGLFSSSGTTELNLSTTSTDTNTPHIIGALSNSTFDYANLIISSNTTRFNISGTERMRIDSSGNVGIGVTNTFGSKVFVLGSANVGVSVSDGSNTIAMYGNGGTAVGLGTANSVPLFFTTAATERMKIDSAGNVGIGTSSPLGRLSVLGGGRLVTIGDSGTANTPAITVRTTTDTGYGFLNISTYRTKFFTEGSERMVISESGNVGIGTSIPEATLHVRNGTSVGGLIEYDGQSNTEFGLRIQSNISGGNFESDFTNGTTALLDLFANSSVTSGGDLLVARTQSATPILLVKGSGNVGIGTSSPACRLQTYGLGEISSSGNNIRNLAYFQADTTVSNSSIIFNTNPPAGQNLRGFAFNYQSSGFSIARFHTDKTAAPERDLTIDSSGRVGIGISTPDHELHVYENTNGNIARFESQYSGSNSNLTIDGGTANTIKLHAGYFDTLELGANDTTYAKILTNGNFQFNSGYGSVATAYGCRAWVNFNGYTVAIRGSQNVSSITDNGTGKYTMNFSSAMPDTNYAAVAAGNGGGDFGDRVCNTTPNSTSSCRVYSGVIGSTTTYDAHYLQVAIIR